jgi:hypothetical protein
MANPEQLEILKQGAKKWNEWRRNNPEVVIDLFNAELPAAELSGADLVEANLGSAFLVGANLAQAELRGADLGGAKFIGANLVRGNLHDADLRGVNFDRAMLAGADLSWADLSLASLYGANLTRADLGSARFFAANLAFANLTEASLFNTVFAENDLSEVEGLETVLHAAPSTIGIDTIYKSKGNIPEDFLRGCGVPEDFIVYMKSLVGKVIEFYSCFISYSSKDDDFARRLHADLQAQNVRCWFASEDLKIGDKFRTRIDEAIRVHDKLLLVLSENSVNSAWVEKEVETAFEKEKRQRGKPVLFPIRLDDAVMQTDQAWAADVRRTRHIGDFTHWKDHDAYQQAFQRLLRGLKAEQKAPGRELGATSH